MRETFIIGISGKQYSGKDVLADLLVEALPGFQKIPLALAIKQTYAQQHGLTLEEIEAHKAHYRPDLIALGNWGRSQDPDYWIKQVLNIPGKKIISDVRLKREFDILKANGAFLIRLEASREVRAQRGQIISETDRTECDLDEVQGWDVVIENNGDFGNLKDQASKLLAFFT